MIEKIKTSFIKNKERVSSFFKKLFETKKSKIIAIACFIFLFFSTIFLIYIQETDNQEIETGDSLSTIGQGDTEETQKTSVFDVFKSKKSEPKNTPTPLPEEQNNDNSNQDSNDSDTPTPTSVEQSVEDSSPTNTPILTPTPTSQPPAQATSTPTPTLIPTPTPTQASVPTQDFSFNLDPVNDCSPNGDGIGGGTVTKNENMYWDYEINASFSDIKPNTNYQLWICHNSGNCSSHTSARFMTDGSGSGNLNASIGSVSQGDPVNKIVLKNNDTGGSICLQTPFGF